MMTAFFQMSFESEVLDHMIRMYCYMNLILYTSTRVIKLTSTWEYFFEDIAYKQH